MTRHASMRRCSPILAFVARMEADRPGPDRPVNEAFWQVAGDGREQGEIRASSRTFHADDAAAQAPIRGDDLSMERERFADRTADIAAVKNTSGSSRKTL